MSHSGEWELVYKAGLQHTSWPWSDLVSLVKRHVPSTSSNCRVLELGCGTGANVPFFSALGTSYHGIEGSETAVAVLHRKFPELRHTVAVGDFTKTLSPGPFDLVVDRASLTHNSTAAIRHTLELVRAVLNPGGLYIGVDWFSERHSDRQYGLPAEDKFTFTEFREGQFQGCGRVHFSDESHMRDLFSRFDIVFLEEKTARPLEPRQDSLFSAYNIVARKRHD